MKQATAALSVLASTASTEPMIGALFLALAIAAIASEINDRF